MSSDEIQKVPADFQPNIEYLQAMVALDIPAPVAEIALYNTGNACSELALNYIFENFEMRNLCQSYRADDEYEDCEHFKMVFVVNSALNMGVGKIAAQVGHAAISLYSQLLKDADAGDSLQKWEEYGQKKIVLKGVDHNHLLELQASCTSKDLPCYLIKDAGHTQVPPSSMTVLSIFGEEEIIDNVTGKLKLL